MYYVYILKSLATKKLYFGYTENLRARLAEHNNKYSKATRTFVPFELIYYEAYRAKQDTLVREKQLKQFKQSYSRLKERLTTSLAVQS